MNQHDLQIWNDAVSACREAAWSEVQAMETAAADGMPNPARAVVRAVGNQHKAGDDRLKINIDLTAKDFPTNPDGEGDSKLSSKSFEFPQPSVSRASAFGWILFALIQVLVFSTYSCARPRTSDDPLRLGLICLFAAVSWLVIRNARNEVFDLLPKICFVPVVVTPVLGIFAYMFPNVLLLTLTMTMAFIATMPWFFMIMAYWDDQKSAP